jgi:hypothetical protein
LLHKSRSINVRLEGFLTFNAESVFMGKCTRTIGERRLGRTIYKIGNSVELSSKEGKAKLAEQNYKQKAQAAQGYADDSPIQNLRDTSKRNKK